MERGPFKITCYHQNAKHGMRKTSGLIVFGRLFLSPLTEKCSASEKCSNCGRVYSSGMSGEKLIQLVLCCHRMDELFVSVVKGGSKSCLQVISALIIFFFLHTNI